MTTRHRLQKTKIIATIGPACDAEITLRGMLMAGMNVARLNLSHGTLDEHAQRVARVRRAAADLGANLAIMVDTRGREIRTGKIDGGIVVLETGQDFTLYGEARPGNIDGVSVSHTTLYDHVKLRDRILLDDGLIELSVTGVALEGIRCKIECGGELRDNKGVNLPANTSIFDSIDSDVAGDLEFIATHDVEYVAASFIRDAADINRLRAKLDALGADTPIIAKIESRDGVENIDEIIAVADGTMVARGDLGVELDLAQGPIIQKRIIRSTVTNGKPVITATQMLDSMERNPRPTRAEVSDVANAILDGTSAVMLSGETAAGAYPVEAVRTIAALAREAETGLKEFGHLQQILPHASDRVTDAIAQASITMANHLKAAAIVALTETGFTSRLISKYRPDCPILAISSSSRVVRRLAMNWGVMAIHYQGDGSDQDRLDFATRTARESGYARGGDIIIATTGSHQRAGSTDLIRVLTLE
ncbi:MAG: pyruvate kinase [Proteobacteria bacterium]|nr:MAG: pyruvate kinase [Pseudomonadota bacterium]